MILVDTSVWVDHLRSGNSRLRSFLIDNAVYCHPFVIGELSCGNLRNRTEVIRLLSALPMCDVVAHDAVLELVNSNPLFGRGVGWVDAHLVAATIGSGIHLWTKDKRLCAIAEELKIAPPRT